MNESEVVVGSKDIWVLGMAFFMLALAVGVLIVNVVAISRQAQDAAETHSAVCAFKTQLVGQIRSSEQYLIKHPDGAPALHLSAASIQQSINKEQATVNSLAGLNCS